MGSIFGTILAFLIVFGVLVFVHEFGHFFMAKLVKIRVEVFSWGIGKRLFGLKKRETDYRVSLIPLGGYVKFSGEEALAGEETLEKGKLKPYDFMAKKRWERFLVLFMGSVMNIFLALILVSVINMVGVTALEHQGQKPVIGWIEPGSPAARADLKVGDEILRINKRKTKTWNDVDLAVGTKPKWLINLEMKRGQEILKVPLITEKVQLMTGTKTRYETGHAGFFGKILNQVIEVTPNSPAEKAGFKAEDVILAINGESVYYHQLNEVIENNPGKELEFLLERGRERLKLKVVPRLEERVEEAVILSWPFPTLRMTLRFEERVGKIGIVSLPKSVFKRYGFFSAIAQSFKQNSKLAFILVNYVRDLMTGEASARQVAGPIAIANFSYTYLRMGFFPLIGFIAFVSLQLGIINLFPIPILDGGQILVLTLEGIVRRDFSPKVKQIVIQIGFFIFILLFTFVVLNDVVRSLPKGWESLLFWK
jgi:regulator of sigma E protease